ncbi:hypothetical protein FD755_011553, partial [Muntiacus reevesi]
LIRCGYRDVVTGSRNPKFAAEFYHHVVDVTHQEEHYILQCDLRHLLINQYPTSNVEYLASLFLDSLIVKGFNVVSTWASCPITLWQIEGETMTEFIFLGSRITVESDAGWHVYICSNNIQAPQNIIELAGELNFVPVDLESEQYKITPVTIYLLERTSVVAINLAMFFFLYYLVHPCTRNRQSDFYKISDETVNKTLPIGVITFRSLTYLQCREQLELLSFYLTLVHLAYSLCLPVRIGNGNSGFAWKISWTEEPAWPKDFCPFILTITDIV